MRYPMQMRKTWQGVLVGIVVVTLWTAGGYAQDHGMGHWGGGGYGDRLIIRLYGPRCAGIRGAACHHSQTPLQSLTQNETRTFCIACREEIWHMMPARFDSKWESSRSTT